METKAILRVAGDLIDLYLPEDVWDKLIKQVTSNRLTVVLRMMSEYQGELKLEEKPKA